MSHLHEVRNSTAANKILEAKNKKELNAKVDELYKENPFMVAPSGYSKTSNDIYSKIEDKLNVNIEKYVPNLDDLETMTVAVIGVVPVVGPAMQGIFTMMSTKMKGTQREETITKDTIKNMVDTEFAKSKKELMDTMDKKIEKSKIEQLKKTIEQSFNGLKESHLELLYESLTHLKVRLLNNEIPSKNDPLLTGIRSKFDSLRTNLKMLLGVVLNKDVLLYVPNIAVEVMAIYILVLKDLINHWHQYQFDPQYALGTPADDEEPATHSYREKLHLNIQRFFKAMYECKTHIIKKERELKDMSQEYCYNESDKLKKQIDIDGGYLMNLPIREWKELKCLSSLFESDPIYYPIPLAKLNVNKSSDKIQTIQIKTSEKKGPVIYRIDAKALIESEKVKSLYLPPGLYFGPENSSGSKPNAGESDSATNCIGTFVKDCQLIKIELDEKKYIRVRWFFFNSHSNTSVEYGLLNDDDMITFYMGKCRKLQHVDTPDQLYGTFLDFEYYAIHNFGLYTTNKTSEKKDKFILTTEVKIKVNDQYFPPNNYSKLNFIEIIVSDE